MARAAVRAKQAQAAQAQAAAKPRRDRKHASGGNPNQDLFFSRLRRKQRWVFIGLAVLFAVTFAGLGVGTGGAGLGEMWNGIFGGSGDAISAAKAEIKTNPSKGYRDLADAYVRENNVTDAIAAMQQYLDLKKTDSTAWALLAGYEKTQGDTYATQYQQLSAYAQLQAPSSALTPAGTLGAQLGTNPIDAIYSKQYQAQLSPLYTNATNAYNASLEDYQKAAKYAKPADKAVAWQAVAIAAQSAGKGDVALKAWKHYVQLDPTSPQLQQIEATCKQLGGSCVPKKPQTK